MDFVCKDTNFSAISAKKKGFLFVLLSTFINFAGESKN